MIAFITELNENNYNYFISDGSVLIYFIAECEELCRTISPIIDEISSEYLNIKVGILNIDLLTESFNIDLYKDLGIRNIPAIVLFKDGEIVGRLIGNITKNEIVELINTYS